MIIYLISRKTKGLAFIRTHCKFCKVKFSDQVMMMFGIGAESSEVPRRMAASSG